VRGGQFQDSGFAGGNAPPSSLQGPALGGGGGFPQGQQMADAAVDMSLLDRMGSSLWVGASTSIWWCSNKPLVVVMFLCLEGLNN
jgi:hypothetical protein